MALLMYKWFMISCLSFLTGSAGNMNYINRSVEQKPLHPFYLSVTEISHNASSRSVEISCKMFAEDLEAILEKNNKTTLDITTAKDKAQFDKFIAAYMSGHLALAIDGKTVSLNYVGYEVDNESAFVYLEIENIATARKFDVSNTLLHDFINEQINIVHVTVNGNRKSTKMNFPEKHASFSF